MLKLPYPFENRMSRIQTIIFLIYLPIHMFVLPLLLPYLIVQAGEEDLATVNLLYYATGQMLVLAVGLSFLRREFDPLIDRPGHCILTFFMALGLDYVLSIGVSAVILAVTNGVDNPNDSAIAEIALESGGMMTAVAVFIAPILEEVLFRGALFGSLRKRSRLLAYVVSILVFALYHVWQYAVAAGDWTMLIYVLQYVPVSLALTWAYERSGCLWVSIGFHMMINYMSLAVEKLAAQMM